MMSCVGSQHQQAVTVLVGKVRVYAVIDIGREISGVAVAGHVEKLGC